MASKMSSLMDLVSQNQPHFKTHQALLVIGMQNDFIQPDGRLPVSTENGYLDRIQALIPKFRKLNGNVIWVQTLYEEDRIANDANTGEGDAMVVGGLVDGDESSTEGGVEEEAVKDLAPEKAKSKHKQRALDILKRVSARRKTLPREVAKATVEQDDELFLMKSEKKMPACVPDTHGAQFADVIAMQFELPADSVIKTSNYSAFQGTPLLMTLRARLVTELFICGCITNVSVLATVIDAARHGVKINVIEDCLGYRKQSRHEVSLKRMDEFFDAYLVKSTEILAREPAASGENNSSSPSSSRKGSKGEKPLEAMVGRLSLNDGEARPSSRTSSIRSPTRVLTGGQRKLSLVSVAESRKALSTPPAIQQAAEPTDKEFADNLVRGAIIPVDEDRAQNGEKEETKLVSKKIRMRSSKARKKKKKTDEDVPKDATEAAAEPLEAINHPAEPAVDAPKPKPVTPTAVAAPKPQPPQPEQEKRRGSLLSRAESVLNLRDKMTKQQSLKSVASQPVLNGKAETKEKEKDRDSWSDRMRMSLSRAPKSDSASESKNRLSYVSTKAPSTPSRAESRPASIAATIAEVPLTPSRIPEPVVKATPEAHAATVAPQTPTQPTPELAAPTAPNDSKNKKSKIPSLANLPILGPDDKIGEGDSSIVYDFLKPDLTHPTEPTMPLREVIFTQLYNEVSWQKMLHQTGEVPRLVCCQGEFGDDGSMPVYRHPSDQTLPLLHFSPKVQIIRRQAEKVVGHTLNHVLIQLYRSGEDYISEHSDKTLDIVRGSSIVNVSFGAQRTMRLRTKRSSKSTEDPQPSDGEDKSRTTQRIHLPHNSLFTLGPSTNALWLHGIQPDKRLPTERSPSELAYNGMRISLTFRHIGTFLDARSSVIWGQGATAKSHRDAADVINGDVEESANLVRAFSLENRSSGDFDWKSTYGTGFDVLHLHSSPPDIPMFFATHNTIETRQSRLALWEAKIDHIFVDPPALDPAFEIDRKVMFRDTDVYHTQVELSTSVFFYLDKWYPFSAASDDDKSITAKTCTLVLLAAGLLKAYYNIHVPGYSAEFTQLLAIVEDTVKQEPGPFIAGRKFSMADCYVWPVVDEIVREWGGWDEVVYSGLGEWYKGCWRRKGCVKKVREKLPEVRKAE